MFVALISRVDPVGLGKLTLWPAPSAVTVGSKGTSKLKKNPSQTTKDGHSFVVSSLSGKSNVTDTDRGGGGMVGVYLAGYVCLTGTFVSLVVAAAAVMVSFCHCGCVVVGENAFSISVSTPQQERISAESLHPGARCNLNFIHRSRGVSVCRGLTNLQ